MNSNVFHKAVIYGGNRGRIVRPQKAIDDTYAPLQGRFLLC